jgi:hypothetical protein
MEFESFHDGTLLHIGVQGWLKQLLLSVVWLSLVKKGEDISKFASGTTAESNAPR